MLPDLNGNRMEPDTKTDRIFLIAALAVAVGLFVYLFANMDRCLWDFKVYYHAAKAFTAGRNPYDMATLSAVAESPVIYNYVYPFFTLYLFIPFTLLNYPAASAVFVVFKGTLFLLLVLLWWRNFITDKKHPGLFLLFAVLAFNGTVFEDLRVGNISIIEQALIWGGLFFFIHGHYLRFCILVTGAACFKMFPLAFLGLLLFTGHPKRFHFTILFILLFAAVLTLARFLNPGYFTGFLTNNSLPILEEGPYNPSTYALLRLLLDRLCGFFNVPVTEIMVRIAWVPVAVLVTGIALRAMHRLQPLDSKDRTLAYRPLLPCVQSGAPAV